MDTLTPKGRQIDLTSRDGSRFDGRFVILDWRIFLEFSVEGVVESSTSCARRNFSTLLGLSVREKLIRNRKLVNSSTLHVG